MKELANKPKGKNRYGILSVNFDRPANDDFINIIQNETNDEDNSGRRAVNPMDHTHELS
jgi:hypothetical protein